MNYIKEMNAFYNRLETNGLSASAINLWYALMHINNRAGLLEEVAVLGVKTSLSESALKRARMELQEKGYIRYRSQGGNRAAIYEIISLVIFDESNGVGDGVGSTADNTNHSMDCNVGCKPNGNVSALFKQNKTKQNKRTTTTGAHQFFQENFGDMNLYIADEITKWVNDTGEPFILIAMKRALERGKANWGYVKGILKAWMMKDIASVEDAMGEEMASSNRGEKRGYAAKQVQEVVPDWFKERELREKQKDSRRREDEALTADQEKVARLLAEYGGHTF